MTGGISREFVTITLIEKADGSLIVRSVELIGETCRARFSFGPEATTEQAFAPFAAAEITGLAARASDQRGMLALPDTVLTLAGLSLGDCRIVSTDARDGGVQILIRFKQMYGDLFVLFAEDYMPKRRLGANLPASNDAVDLLERAYLPLSDLAEHILEVSKDSVKDGGDHASAALIDIAHRIRALDVLGAAKEASRNAIATKVVPGTRLLN